MTAVSLSLVRAMFTSPNGMAALYMPVQGLPCVSWLGALCAALLCFPCLHPGSQLK